MMGVFTESVAEDAALVCVEILSYAILQCADMTAGEPAAKRLDYGQVVLEDCFLPKLISGELRTKMEKVA